MDTIPKLLVHQKKTRGSKPAVRVKQLGLWQTHSWDDFYTSVRRAACGFVDIGIARGEIVAVIGNNTPDMYCAMTACQAIGAVPMPIYGDLSGEDLRHLLNTTNTRFAVVQDQQQVDALLDLKGLVQDLQTIIYTLGRGLSDYRHGVLQDFESVKQRGDSYASINPTFFENSIDQGNAEDLAFILFNSGIAQKPQAVKISYKNALASSRFLIEEDDVTDADEVLSFMPISLAQNLLAGFVVSYQTGLCVSCPESTETVMQNLHEVSPTFLYAPPYVYKQIAASIHERIELATGLRRWLYDYYIGNAMRNKRRSDFGLGEALVMAPIKDLYGLGRLRFALTGGDTINADLFAFFQALGVELKQVYGTTETFGCITHQTMEKTADNVGHAAKGVEIKISDESEILCRGDNVFSGYLNDTASTMKAFDADGWYRTGDIGEMREDKVLHIYDKFLARTQTSGGGFYLPKVIENAVKVSPYVREAFVTSGTKDDLVALIVIDGNTVGIWAERHNVRYAGYADLTTKQEVQSLIVQAVADANELARQQQQPPVTSFILLHRMLSPQLGELTWSNKLRRKFLREAFQEIIDAACSHQENARFMDSKSDDQVVLSICRC